MFRFKKKNKIFSPSSRFKSFNRLSGSSKQYNNPFFVKRKGRDRFKKSSSISIYVKLIILACLVIIGVLVWLLLYSNFFTIKNSNINYEGRISKDEIQNLINDQMNGNRLIFLPQKNIFLFNKEALQASLENKYVFQEIKISKKLLSTLILDLKEKPISAIWQEDGRVFYIDDTGKIIQETNSEDIKNKDYPFIDNLSSKKIQDNNVQVASSSLQFVLNLFSKLGAYKNEFKVSSYTIDDELYTVKLNLENGPKLYFNTQADIDQQIAKVLAVKKEQLKSDFNKKEYINVRIEDRVYYR